MAAADGIMSLLSEESLALFLDTFRELGPLPGVLLTFMKSFVPPLPTALIVGLNAAVYGLWAGFLYSWIGIVSGCVLTFYLVQKAGSIPLIRKWAAKPKVLKGQAWIQRNGFSYVFLLSILPIGPFVAINIAAGLGGMKMGSYLTALIPGKGLMVLLVSLIGANVESFIQQPLWVLVVLAAVLFLLWVSKKVEAIVLGKQKSMIG
ncbi:TVP38/TMEM64 family protein [Paenibacillus sp. F411]|nr:MULTISPECIES: VTT domain-containing protein [Paenibacillus]MBO2944244.1 TVP38/TMEM64 family protein [Paenibacillus sp. F411]